MRPDLIYDVGMHAAFDTEFYLRKGFRVVAVEANPKLCAAAVDRLLPYIDAGRLRIVNMGITDKSGVLPFTVNLSKDDWSSFVPELGRRDGAFETMDVPCSTLDQLFTLYGEVPYYLKIDIEGFDYACIGALSRLNGDLPKFVSVERMDDFGDIMHALGYRRFTVISQVWHQYQSLPRPAREGRFVEQKMTGHHSGPFGDETYGPWLGLDEFNDEASRVGTDRYAGSIHERLGCPREVWDRSWFDFHAALGE